MQQARIFSNTASTVEKAARELKLDDPTATVSTSSDED